MASDFKIDAIVLPYAPQDVDHVSDQDTKTVNLAGIIISMAEKPRVLKWEGDLHETGQNQQYLVNTYITPILAKQGTEVTLSGPTYEWWHNTNWLLKKTRFRKMKGKVTKYRYSLRFEYQPDILEI